MTQSTPSRRSRRWLRWLSIIVGVIVLSLAVLYFVFNEPAPKGEPGPAADALAQKMLTAIDKPAWDSTAIIQWTFKGMHTFLWDKDRHLVEVKWDNQRVLLNTKQVDGKAWEGEQELSGAAADELIQKAWSFFCNDSFWLNAPAKVFDPGTERRVVKMEDGREALLVVYTSGGVTPGDQYLWILDEQGLPQSWKMWVSIIPIGGVAFSWEAWETLPTGAKISTFHKSSILDLDISNLKAARDLAGFGLTDDPFAPIAN